MDVQEFSNQFDVLYNNITSNQASGLDEYEKSVFLTKAQNETLLSYFDPRKNKVQEGYDGSQRRQIDFSNITRVYTVFDKLVIVIDVKGTQIPEINIASFKSVDSIIKVLGESKYDASNNQYTVTNANIAGKIFSGFEDSELDYTYDRDSNTYSLNLFSPALFDNRKNSISVNIPEMLLFINEKTIVKREGRELELVTVPIQYIEYDRLMSKPYKRPVKNQAWRLINNSESNKADIIVGPVDTILKYSIRYLKRPKPIIVANLDDLEIEGYNEATECELDPIIHHEILQRAVELAKAAYSGTLQDTVSLGQLSQTDIGIITQSK